MLAALFANENQKYGKNPVQRVEIKICLNSSKLKKKKEQEVC